MSSDKVKDFVVISFGNYCESTREKLYSKLSEEQSLQKVAKAVYVFLTIPDEVEKYVEMMQSSFPDNCLCHDNIKILNPFDPELQLINTKPMIKEKLKELLSDLKRFKIQSILVVEYKKRYDHKINHSNVN